MNDDVIEVNDDVIEDGLDYDMEETSMLSAAHWLECNHENELPRAGMPGETFACPECGAVWISEPIPFTKLDYDFVSWDDPIAQQEADDRLLLLADDFATLSWTLFQFLGVPSTEELC